MAKRCKKCKKDTSNENFENNIEEHFDNGCVNDTHDNEYLDKLIQYDKEDYDRVIKPNFIEAQFHNDYRDTITAFNNIAPNQKQIFNEGNIPVIYTNPPLKEVKKMIKDFICEVNKNVISSVPDYLSNNSGWDEPLPQKRIKFGWEKQMEALGLPTNLYPDPAKKERIRLIAIDHVEKYETEDEIKYVVYIYIQKKNVKDQLIVKVSFVMSKRLVNQDRKFFDNKFKPDEEHIIIEEIFILGYMTYDSTNRSNKKPDDFYNFDRLEDQEMLDQKIIMKELLKKHRERTTEMKNFNANLDTEGRIFRGELPNIMGSNSYQSTQTIFDDFTKERNLN